MPEIEDIQRYCFEQIDLLPAQFKDLDFVPREYPVICSERLKTMTEEFKPG
jgi:hypothetical protein